MCGDDFALRVHFDLLSLAVKSHSAPMEKIKKDGTEP